MQIASIPEGQPLDQGDPTEIAKWRDWVNARLLPEGKRAVLSGDRGKINQLLQEIEAELQEPYLAGEFSLADVSVAPLVQRIESEFGIDPEQLPRVEAWWRRLRERAGVHRTIQPSWWWWW